MSTPRAQGALRTAAVFSLCALFAVLAMGLTLLASSVYRSTAADADQNYTQRAALSYLVNQIRRSDETSCVALTEFGGSDAIALTERLDEAEYITLLYCYDGQLRELYTEKGTELTPADGTAILALERISLLEEDGLVRVTAEDKDGNLFAASVALRSGAGEAAE